MIRSMTGFGTASSELDGSRIVIEIQSLNSRYCEISVRCTRSLLDVEAKIRDLVQKRIERGKVSVALTWEAGSGTGGKIAIDIDLAGEYRNALALLKDELNVPGEIDISLLSRMPDLFRIDSETRDTDRVWPVVEKTCNLALERHEAMRRAEGEAIARDLRQRIGVIEAALQGIERLAPLRTDACRRRLAERIGILMAPGIVDESRLAMEVALLAERCDITEECVRFRSHNAQFLEAIEAADCVGRRLNFLLQEMGREANTIGSKADDADISRLIIAVKEELEKLREQTQNIE